ncbi:MAG: DNA topoisomerase IB, partial [Pyrinomonadaceae bacterium]
KHATDIAHSAKDLRTWAGTLLTAVELAEIGKTDDPKLIKANVIRAVRCVASQLGNTPTVCRSSYIHPAVIACYEAGITLEDFRPRRTRSIRRIQPDYEPEEIALIKLLQTKV